VKREMNDANEDAQQLIRRRRFQLSVVDWSSMCEMNVAAPLPPTGQ